MTDQKLGQKLGGLDAALIVVDLQPDFMPGGALAVAEGDLLVAPIAALVRKWRENGDNGPIVATQDWHPPGHMSFASRYHQPPFSVMALHGGEQTLWPDHCVQGSAGAQLVEGLPKEPLQLILRKGACEDADSYSAFRENRGKDGERRTTGLSGLLRARGVRQVFVCGLARDFCVAWTALDAVAEGFAVTVIDDLCRAVYPDRAAETDAEFAAAGIRCVQSSSLL